MRIYNLLYLKYVKRGEELLCMCGCMCACVGVCMFACMHAAKEVYAVTLYHNENLYCARNSFIIKL